MNQFDQETRLDADGTGLLSGNWSIGSNPNGGYLMALAVRAMGQLCTQHPHPLSVTAHYQRPGLGDQPCAVHAKLLRSGASISTVTGSLVQEDKSRLELIAAFGTLGEGSSALDFAKAPPNIPQPDDCPPRTGHAQGVDLPILNRIEVKLAPSSNGHAQVNGWVRLRDGREPDALACLLFVDAFPPAIFGRLGQVGWVPTVELTVHIRRRPVPGWIQGQFSTEDLADGRMIENGYLWDSQGNLVAQSRQLAMLLKK